MTHKHGELVKACLVECELRGILAHENPVGGGMVKQRGQARSRWQDFGLGKGSGDIIGCLPDGKYLAIECKIGRDVLRPDQGVFIMDVIKLDGRAIVVRDNVTGLATQLDELGYPETRAVTV